MDDAVAKLSINRLIVIPFTIHPVLQTPIAAKRRAAPVIVCSASYSDIVDYNTNSHASFFFEFFCVRFYALGERPVGAATCDVVLNHPK